jgi:hypothetical protein
MTWLLRKMPHSRCDHPPYLQIKKRAHSENTERNTGQYPNLRALGIFHKESGEDTSYLKGDSERVIKLRQFRKR